jgi:pyruvate kinase
MLPNATKPHGGLSPKALSALWAEVDTLCAYVASKSQERYAAWAPQVRRATFLPSGRNLAAYLAFREHDLRELQDQLVPLGLSSLGRCEGHVLPTIAAVRATLGALHGVENADSQRPRLRDFTLGDWLLKRNTRSIFGSHNQNRPHIMVTLPSESATDHDLVRRLVEAGMDCARINCAHDEPDVWRGMASNVRRAERETKQPCRVYMDIAGPKIRIERVVPNHPKRRYVAGDKVHIICSEGAILNQLRVGAPVWIDDGKLAAVVVEVAADGFRLKITRTGPKGAKIRVGKGLNFPETPLNLPALSEKDLTDLDSIVANADIVGQSFVRDAQDIETLLCELERRNVKLPVVAKIETASAISNLPEIIVAGAGKIPLGIMIARGDLAIEIGYQRLAEIQEELLWLCEAAHVPIVWATQVLDQFVRKGVPSRAEITDAAMAERAECVMLNKGPYIVEGVSVLSDVLTRMQGHQAKKSPRLRALHSWSTSG